MNIYVGNLSYQTTEDELRDLFAEFGDVVSAKLIADKFTGQSKGFGFVEMSDNSEAKKAMDELNGRDLNGRSITVNEARPRQERPRGGGNRVIERAVCYIVTGAGRKRPALCFEPFVRIDSEIARGLPLTGAVDASSDTDVSQPSQRTPPYTSHWRYSTAALGWYQSFLALSRLPTASNQAVSDLQGRVERLADTGTELEYRVERYIGQSETVGQDGHAPLELTL